MILTVFSGYTAWFSSSVTGKKKDLWFKYGGKAGTVEKADFLYSEDAECEDTLRVFESQGYLDEHLAVFHPAYIMACVQFGSIEKVNSGKYFFPPAEVQTFMREQEDYVGYEDIGNEPDYKSESESDIDDHVAGGDDDDDDDDDDHNAADDDDYDYEAGYAAYCKAFCNADTAGYNADEDYNDQAEDPTLNRNRQRVRPTTSKTYNHKHGRQSQNMTRRINTSNTKPTDTENNHDNSHLEKTGRRETSKTNRQKQTETNTERITRRNGANVEPNVQHTQEGLPKTKSKKNDKQVRGGINEMEVERDLANGKSRTRPRKRRKLEAYSGCVKIKDVNSVRLGSFVVGVAGCELMTVEQS